MMLIASPCVSPLPLLMPFLQQLCETYEAELAEHRKQGQQWQQRMAKERRARSDLEAGLELATATNEQLSAQLRDCEERNRLLSEELERGNKEHRDEKETMEHKIDGLETDVSKLQTDLNQTQVEW